MGSQKAQVEELIAMSQLHHMSPRPSIEKAPFSPTHSAKVVLPPEIAKYAQQET